jgi:cell division septation protein DedD
MASGGKRGSATERVLEGRHVIGLFMLMMLFSGVFFTLGYVIARNQYEGQVNAASGLRSLPDSSVSPKSEITPRSSSRKAAPAASFEPAADLAPSASPDFYHAGDPNKIDDSLKPAARAAPASGKSTNATKQVNAAAKANFGPPQSSATGLNLQVAAMTKEADAMTLANTLRKKNFPTFVQPPLGDKYYHVLVGPYPDLKAAENAKKGLEVAGFKAIVKH